jgi:hypothetical protein
MIDVVLGARIFEGVRLDGFPGVESRLYVRRGRTHIARRREVGSVVGQDDVDLARDGRDQASQEVAAVRRATFSCSSTKANFEVRSISTIRCHRPVEPAGEPLAPMQRRLSFRPTGWCGPSPGGRG